MEIFTRDRNFVKQYAIDKFISVIWTERYQGDSELELVVPATREMFQKIPLGQFIGCNKSKEIMIVNTINIDSGSMKVTGTSLLSFLNNRFIRSSNKPEDKYWYLNGNTAGQSMALIVQNFCIDSDFLNGVIPIGVEYPQQFKIQGLTVGAADASGPPLQLAIPFGPVFDALKSLATTYSLGMQITLEVPGTNTTLNSTKFRSYRGTDRTSKQSKYNYVRFSPDTETFSNIKELQSISGFKTSVWSWAPANPAGEGNTIHGASSKTDKSYLNYDLRALMIFCDDLTTDMIGGSTVVLQNVLNQRASQALADNNIAKAVDGQVTPLHQFQYGVHYYLGDTVEVQGNSGVIQNARITEYIYAQDNAGERGYPTVTVLD